MRAPPHSTRRRFLRLGTGLGLAAGAGPVVSMLGCGGSSPTEPEQPSRPGNPLSRPPELSGELVELGEAVNASAHPHPFHVHAVQFQVASRTSGPLGPHETGWKDTVLVWPGERMELLMRFGATPACSSCTATTSSTRMPG